MGMVPVKDRGRKENGGDGHTHTDRLPGLGDIEAVGDHPQGHDAQGCPGCADGRPARFLASQPAGARAQDHQQGSQRDRIVREPGGSGEVKAEGERHRNAACSCCAPQK